MAAKIGIDRGKKKIRL